MHVTTRRFGVSVGLCLLLATTVSATAQEPKAPSRGGKTLDEWILLLKSKDVNERCQAAWNIGQIGGPSSTEAIPLLLECLSVKHIELQRHAQGALARVGVDAVPALIDAAQSDDPDRRYFAVWAINAIGPPAKAAVPTLVKLLKHKEADMRDAAIWSLGGLGPSSQEAVPALIDAFHAAKKVKTGSREPEFIVVNLGRIGPAAKEAVPFLCDLLKKRNDSLFERAAYALGQIGPDAKAAVPLLIAGDDIKTTRAVICIALGGIGPDAKDGVPLLLAALKDDSAMVRRYAAEALPRVDPAAAKKAGVK